MEEENVTMKQEYITMDEYITPQITVHEMEPHTLLASSIIVTPPTKKKNIEIEDMTWDEDEID